MADTRTATEVLIQAMEEFAKSEGREVIVVFTDESGDLVRMSNAPLNAQVGLLECAKQGVLRRMFQVKSDG
jgi:hypothetical protein